MSELDTRDLPLFRLQRPALIVGGVGLLLCVLGAVLNPERCLRAYLYGYLFWLGIALGSMGIVMLHHLVGGAWGLLIRRPAEAAAMTLPLMVVLFIPIAVGLRYLYPWADAELLSREEVLRHRHPFFNPAWFLGRAVVYFAVWLYFAWRIRRLSLIQDVNPSAATARSLQRNSALGLVLYFITMSLASVDWIMSREIHWYSTVFGFIVICSQGLAAFVFLMVVLWELAKAPPLRELIHPNYLNDLGNFLLMLVILWAYLSFAQLLVTWMGNTQEDITWYVHRSHGGWRYLVIVLVVLHFFVPFFLLLLKDVKRDLRRLAMLCAGILVMHVLFVLWMIEPSGRGEEAHGIGWMDFVTPWGIGGIWFAVFLWLLRRRPLVPLGEPFPPPEPEHHGRPSPSPAV